MNPLRRPYIISLTAKNKEQRTAMRNALWRLNASEVLPGLYLAYLSQDEHKCLTRRFGVRVRPR